MALTLDKSAFVKKKHYVEFVDKYTTPAGLGVDGNDCYRLRGGVVHRANMAGHPEFNCTHVVFTIPETRTSIHALSMVAGEKRAAVLDLKTFCRAIVVAAERWYEDHKDSPTVAENMKNLIRMCPNGLHPFVGGAPVVGSGQ